jgi:hypothetical protein
VNTVIKSASVVSAALLCLAAGTAVADSVAIPLDATTISTGTTIANPPTNPTLTGPSYSYSNTIAAGTGMTNVAGTQSGFFDEYVFTIAASTADSVTSTINLGSSQISNLQASLFTYNPSAGTSLPLFGSNLPAGTTEIDAWSTAFSGGSFAVIQPVTLTAGTYALEIRGSAASSGGGTYSGVLDLAPTAVPLPAGLPLLLSGLFGVGFLGRRRR